jgi:dTDP-4-amino-4,6-dideoxygalactose transaminase
VSTTVVSPGINAKMNELQASFVLLHLNYIDGHISERKEISDYYTNSLKDIPGIKILKLKQDFKSNYSYFPILINQTEYGISRDELYELFKTHNIYTRRYFYPLISEFPTYSGLPSATSDNIPNATQVTKEVLCLPIYPELLKSDMDRVSYILQKKI